MGPAEKISSTGFAQLPGRTGRKRKQHAPLTRNVGTQAAAGNPAQPPLSTKTKSRLERYLDAVDSLPDDAKQTIINDEEIIKNAFLLSSNGQNNTIEKNQERLMKIIEILPISKVELRKLKQELPRDYQAFCDTIEDKAHTTFILKSLITDKQDPSRLAEIIAKDYLMHTCSLSQLNIPNIVKNKMSAFQPFLSKTMVDFKEFETRIQNTGIEILENVSLKVKKTFPHNIHNPLLTQCPIIFVTNLLQVSNLRSEVGHEHDGSLIFSVFTTCNLMLHVPMTNEMFPNLTTTASQVIGHLKADYESNYSLDTLFDFITIELPPELNDALQYEDDQRSLKNMAKYIVYSKFHSTHFLLQLIFNETTASSNGSEPTNEVDEFTAKYWQFTQFNKDATSTMFFIDWLIRWKLDLELNENLTISFNSNNKPKDNYYKKKSATILIFTKLLAEFRQNLPELANLLSKVPPSQYKLITYVKAFIETLCDIRRTLEEIPELNQFIRDTYPDYVPLMDAPFERVLTIIPSETLDEIKQWINQCLELKTTHTALFNRLNENEPLKQALEESHPNCMAMLNQPWDVYLKSNLSLCIEDLNCTRNIIDGINAELMQQQLLADEQQKNEDEAKKSIQKKVCNHLGALKDVCSTPLEQALLKFFLALSQKKEKREFDQNISRVCSAVSACFSALKTTQNDPIRLFNTLLKSCCTAKTMADIQGNLNAISLFIKALKRVHEQIEFNTDIPLSTVLPTMPKPLLTQCQWPPNLDIDPEHFSDVIQSFKDCTNHLNGIKDSTIKHRYGQFKDKEKAAKHEKLKEALNNELHHLNNTIDQGCKSTVCDALLRHYPKDFLTPSQEEPMPFKDQVTELCTAINALFGALEAIDAPELPQALLQDLLIKCCKAPSIPDIQSKITTIFTFLSTLKEFHSKFKFNSHLYTTLLIPDMPYELRKRCQWPPDLSFSSSELFDFIDSLKTCTSRLNELKETSDTQKLEQIKLYLLQNTGIVYHPEPTTHQYLTPVDLRPAHEQNIAEFCTALKTSNSILYDSLVEKLAKGITVLVYGSLLHKPLKKIGDVDMIIIDPKLSQIYDDRFYLSIDGKQLPIDVHYVPDNYNFAQVGRTYEESIVVSLSIANGRMHSGNRYSAMAVCDKSLSRFNPYTHAKTMPYHIKILVKRLCQIIKKAQETLSSENDLNQYLTTLTMDKKTPELIQLLKHHIQYAMANATFSEKYTLKLIINHLAEMTMHENITVFDNRLKSLDALFGQSNIYQTFEQLKPSKNDAIVETLLNQINHYLHNKSELPNHWPAILGPNLSILASSYATQKK